MIITRVHLVLGTIKGHSKMFHFATQFNATDVSSFEGACNWHVNFSTISCLQCCFREFGSTTNLPHNRRLCLIMPSQDLNIWLLHLQDRLRPAICTTDETGVFLSVIKPFCGGQCILIGWAWLPSGWAYSHPWLCPCQVM
jgi:hypothetical protein